MLLTTQMLPMLALLWELDNSVLCLKVDFLEVESLVRKYSVGDTLNNGFLVQCKLLKCDCLGFCFAGIRIQCNQT